LFDNKNKNEKIAKTGNKRTSRLAMHFDTLDQGTEAFMQWLSSDNKMSASSNPVILKQFVHGKYTVLYDNTLGHDVMVETHDGVPFCKSCNTDEGDFDLLKQDLTEARQALENNDTTALLDELNSASGELFQVISRQFDPAHVEAMSQEFNPLQTHIDQTQEAALKDDHTRMLEELSAAESELLKITQTLPSSQE
jgi:hypothetical protein